MSAAGDRVRWDAREEARKLARKLDEAPYPTRVTSGASLGLARALLEAEADLALSKAVAEAARALHGNPPRHGACRLCDALRALDEEQA